MDSPQISRSGRVLKKSAKVKEMEDFDINELDMQGKPRKKSRTSDEFDEFDDKRVAPIKIPKISLNLQSAGKKIPQPMPKMPQAIAMKPKQGFKRIYEDSSNEGSKESDSSSVTSESSSSSPSSSDDSDGDDQDMRQRFSNVEVKGTIMQNIQHVPPQEKVIVESYRQNSDIPMEASEDETSDSALVIAEESNDSFVSHGQKSALSKKKLPPKKDPNYAPRKNVSPKKKPPNRNAAAKKPKPAGKSKPLTAYMLWCSENRKRIATSSGIIGFGNIGKKMGEAWQALPDKEKMAWRRKAKRLALKNSGGLISTGPTNGTSPKSTNRSTSTVNDDVLRNLSEGTRALGTSPIDSAAYLKLLGDSLSVIGQRLTEHEGQLAVSGIFLFFWIPYFALLVLFCA